MTMTLKKEMTIEEVNSYVAECVKKYPVKVVPFASSSTYKCNVPLGNGLCLTDVHIRPMDFEPKADAKVDLRAFVNLGFNADPEDINSRPAITVSSWRLMERRQPEEGKAKFYLSNPTEKIAGRFIDRAMLGLPGETFVVSAMVTAIYNSVKSAKVTPKEVKVSIS